MARMVREHREYLPEKGKKVSWEISPMINDHEPVESRLVNEELYWLIVELREVDLNKIFNSAKTLLVVHGGCEGSAIVCVPVTRAILRDIRLGIVELFDDSKPPYEGVQLAPVYKVSLGTLSREK